MAAAIVVIATTAVTIATPLRSPLAGIAAATTAINYRGRWYYGPPPSLYGDVPTMAIAHWRRGERLPRYYRDQLRRGARLSIATAIAIRRAATTMSATIAATFCSSASQPA